MAIQGIDATPQPRRIGRSILAVLAGLVFIFVLSLGIDQLFHVLGVYPPWGEPMNDTGDNALDFGGLTVPTPGTGPLAAIPEPGTASLVGAGSLLLARRRARRVG